MAKKDDIKNLDAYEAEIENSFDNNSFKSVKDISSRLKKAKSIISAKEPCSKNSNKGITGPCLINTVSGDGGKTKALIYIGATLLILLALFITVWQRIE